MAETTSSKVTFFDTIAPTKENIGTVASNGIFFTPPTDNNPKHIAHGGVFYTYGSYVTVASGGDKQIFTFDKNSNTNPLTVSSPSVICGATSDQYAKSITLSAQTLSFANLATAFNDLYSRVYELEQKHLTSDATGIDWAQSNYTAYVGEEIQLIGKAVPDGSRIGNGTITLSLYNGTSPANAANWKMVNTTASLAGTTIYFNNPSVANYNAKLTYTFGGETFTTSNASIAVKAVNISYTFTNGTANTRSYTFAASNISFKSKISDLYTYVINKGNDAFKNDSNYLALDTSSIIVNSSANKVTSTNATTIGSLLSSATNKQLAVYANYKVKAYKATLKLFDGTNYVGTDKTVTVNVSADGTAAMATSSFPTTTGYDNENTFYVVTGSSKSAITVSGNSINVASYKDYVTGEYNISFARKVKAAADTYSVDIDKTSVTRSVSSVSISPSTSSITTAGGSVTFTASATLANASVTLSNFKKNGTAATMPTISVTSSNSANATVSGSSVTFKAAGTFDISVGGYDTKTVTVTDASTAVTLKSDKTIATVSGNKVTVATLPSTQTTVTITATSSADSTKTKTATITVSAAAPAATYYYYWGPYVSRPTSADEMKAATSASSKILSVNVPADNTTSLLFIYPSEWGTAKFKDPSTGAGFGNVKNLDITGYNALFLASTNATILQGETIEFLWT